MKRVIDVPEELYNTCNRLVSEGDPRPSESCIANSEPYEPQGDCISREALKKAIKDNGYSHYFEIFDIIDNAPTVNPDMAQVLAYESGKASNERQKGKWIKETRGGYYIYFRCNSCNSYSTSVKTYFCPNCGADMRKGGAE